MANRGNTWSVPAGQSETFTVTITGESGAITGQYAGTETLTAEVWRGSSLANISGIATPTWRSGTDGTVDVAIAPPSNQTPGFYRVRLSVNYNSVDNPFYAGWVRVEAVPGSTAEPAVYCTLQDLIDLGGEWVTQLMQSQAADETDFLDERARARQWLDDIIVAASRPFAYQFDLTFALYFGSYPWGPVEAPDSTLKGYLDLDQLIVRPRTIECTAYKALEFICQKRQTFDEKGESYARRAAFYHRMASNSLRRYRCEIDTDGDGACDIAFNLSVTSFR